LASLPRNQHSIEFKALQTRWRCTIHPGKFYYKQYDEVPPSDHADLDPKALSDWATAIVNNAHFVDIDYPPHGPEWDTILQPRRRKSSSIETPQPYTQPPIHIHMPSHSPRRSPRSVHRYSAPRSPRTPTRRPHVDLTHDITVHSHCRKNAEICMRLEVSWIWNNPAFGSPSVGPFTRVGIDP